MTILGAAGRGRRSSGAAAAQDATADTVVATVGDTEITLGEVIIARTALPQQYAQFPNEILFNGLVDQLVQQQLLADVMGEANAQIEYTLANERRALMAAEVITDIAETAVTEEDIVAAYEARFADAEEIPEFNASHILLETQEDAAAAKARVDAGEEFATVAQEMSDRPDRTKMAATLAGSGRVRWCPISKTRSPHSKLAASPNHSRRNSAGTSPN